MLLCKYIEIMCNAVRQPSLLKELMNPHLLARHEAQKIFQFFYFLTSIIKLKVSPQLIPSFAGAIIWQYHEIFLSVRQKSTLG